MTDWIHGGAILLGVAILLHAVLKLTSTKYFMFVYELPLLGEIDEKARRQNEREREWRRYAITITEMGVAAGLLYWGFGLW